MYNFIDEGKNIHQLYYWLVYFELEMGVEGFIKEKKYQEKLDTFSLEKLKSIIDKRKNEPFYKRIYNNLFNPINEQIEFYHILKAKEILNKLQPIQDLNIENWDKSILELKELDREIKSKAPVFNFKFILSCLRSWQRFPILPKNKDYLFNSVKYAFQDKQEWNVKLKKEINVKEYNIYTDVNDISKYLHQKTSNAIDKNIEDINNVQNEITGFSTSVFMYYNENTWSMNSFFLRKEIVRSFNNLLTNTLECASSFLKCLLSFKSDNGQNNNAIEKNDTDKNKIKLEINRKLDRIRFDYLKDDVDNKSKLIETTNKQFSYKMR